MLVVGSEGVGSVPPEHKSHKLRRTEELNAQGLDIRVLTEEEFCERAGQPTPDSLKRDRVTRRSIPLRGRRLVRDGCRRDFRDQLPPQIGRAHV